LSDREVVNPERRRFLDLFLAGTGLAAALGILYPLFRYLTPPKQEEAVVSSVNLGPAKDFPVNSGKIFRFGNKPGIIIRGQDGKFRAFSATCTHLDCIVQYDQKAGDIWCACHGGRYNLSGRNISGPPPRPLTPFAVNILPESNEILITPEGGNQG
jgi:cytochrome b6-f complex iron-sulfur subunit